MYANPYNPNILQVGNIKEYGTFDVTFYSGPSCPCVYLMLTQTKLARQV